MLTVLYMKKISQIVSEHVAKHVAEHGNLEIEVQTNHLPLLPSTENELYGRVMVGEQD